MLNVSSGFNAACKASSREWDCKVFTQWEFPFLDIEPTISAVPKVQTTNLTEAAGSKKDQLINGVCEKIYDQMGLTTTNLSNSSGNFTYPYPNVVINWTNLYPVRHVTIVGRDGEYPTSVDIILRNGSTVVYNVTHALTSDFSVIYLGSPYSANVMVISVRAWSAPNSSIKLLQVFPTRITKFANENVISMTVDESIENSGEIIIGSVEAKALNLVLDNSNNDFDPNSNGKYGIYLQKNVKIMPYLGIKVAGVYEYCPMGVYYSDEWAQSDTQTQITVTGLDMMGILDNVSFNYSNWVGGSHPAQVGTYIFHLFNVVLKNKNINIPTTLNPPTANKVLTIASQVTDFINKTCREVLFYLNERVGCFAYFRKNNDFYFNVLSNYSASYDDTISNENYFDIKSPQKNKLSANVFSIIPVNNDKIVSADTADIAKYGETEYVLEGNPTIWNATEATAFFTTCLGSDPRVLFLPEIEIDWQGNPAWEFFDRISISNLSIEFLITSNHYEYNGGLRCTTRGRKLI